MISATRVELFLVFGFVAAAVCVAADSPVYLSCAGHSGTATKQSHLPLLSRTTTENTNPEQGSFAVKGEQIEVDGIPLMSGTYKICQQSGQSLLFSPACYAADPDKFQDLGVLNKVTGDVRYHVGDALFILKCRATAKVIN